jgi:hypothetical protein
VFLYSVLGLSCRTAYPHGSLTRARAWLDDHKWQRLPASWPPQHTCHTHFFKWRRDGVLTWIAEELDIPDESLCAVPASSK